MSSWLVRIPALATAACTVQPVDDELPSPPSGGWQLVWSDEFDGAAGTPPDRGKWTYDLGGHGWGNGQLEFNTDQLANAHHDGAGSLLITALRQRYHSNEYTSARLHTAGHLDQAYGRFEARIKLPAGQGIWPAFWLLGSNFPSAGWPGCGELDIMEARGSEPAINHGSAHGPGYSGGNPRTAQYRLGGGRTFHDDFHVFSLEWSPGEVHWFVDGNHYHAITAATMAPGHAWVFDHAMFVILDVAVGGQFVGKVDDSVLPQSMYIDYVRVYQRAGDP